MKFKKKDNVLFYSRVHKAEIIAEVEFKGDDACIVVHEGTRYSLQNNQIIKVVK